MKKLFIVVAMLLSFVSVALAVPMDVSKLTVKSGPTNTLKRVDPIAGTSADGVTIYQGKKGGYYWRDAAGKKHYIKKTID